MSTYNYNTLTRANDGNAFDFTTNSSVLYVDELPTGVTLQLRIDSQGNPPITLRPKTQLRFKQNELCFNYQQIFHHRPIINLKLSIIVKKGMK